MLVDCGAPKPSNVPSYCGGDGTSNKQELGCGGGWEHMVFEYYRTHLPYSDSSYPFQSGSTGLPLDTCYRRESNGEGVVDKYYFLDGLTQWQIRDHVA